jgi:uncharacterized protein (DUF934 family)
MALVKNGAVVADPWRFPAAGEPLGDGPVAVGKARFLAEREALVSRAGPIGVVIEAGEGLDGLEEDIERFTLIVLTFPKYTDGRAYSTARQLRERDDYRGELRAAGNVLRDQVTFMRRCGFDSFDVAHAGTLAALIQGTIKSVDIHYQPAGLERREAVPPGTRPWLRVTQR